MVATPSASMTSTTSLMQQIHERFSLAQRFRDKTLSVEEIREFINQMKAMSKQLDEMVADYQRARTLFQKSQTNTRRLREQLNIYRTIQESLRPTTFSMAATGVGSIPSRPRTVHEVDKYPSVTKPSPTTESVSTTPEVAIDQFPSDSGTTRSASFSWIVDNQREICAFMTLSLGGGIIVMYSPDEIKLISLVANSIVGTIVSLLMNEIYLSDE